jgi:hypothetical protein
MTIRTHNHVIHLGLHRPIVHRIASPEARARHDAVLQRVLDERAEIATLDRMNAAIDRAEIQNTPE